MSGFGPKLKELREAKGYDQAKLGAILSVGVKQIQRYESDAVIPDVEKIVQLNGEFGYNFFEHFADFKSPNQTPWQRLQIAEQNQDAKIFALENYVFEYAASFINQPAAIKRQLLERLYSDFLDDTNTAQEYAAEVLQQKNETKAAKKAAKAH